MATVVKCVKCNGRGKNFRGEDCNVCGGDGHVVVPDPPTKCSKCSGKGKDFRGDDCTACKGSGYVLS